MKSLAQPAVGMEVAGMDGSDPAERTGDRALVARRLLEGMEHVRRRLAVERQLLQRDDLGTGGDEIGIGEARALAGPLDHQGFQVDADAAEKGEQLPHLGGDDPHPLLLREVLAPDLAVVPEEKRHLALLGRAERMVLQDAGLQGRKKIGHGPGPPRARLLVH